VGDHGRYDYNHATAGTQHAILVILIIFAVLALGGLLVGLNIIDRF
jgi:hypothetical protein